MTPLIVRFNSNHIDMVVKMCQGLFPDYKIALYKNNSIVLFSSEGMVKHEVCLIEIVIITIPALLYGGRDERHSLIFYKAVRNIHLDPGHVVEVLYGDFLARVRRAVH